MPALGNLRPKVRSTFMRETPTLLRHAGKAETPHASDDGDPVLRASVRSRVAALSALAGVVYSVAVPLDLAMHAMFATGGLTSPARLKNLAMALLAWWVHHAAKSSKASLPALTRMAYLLVFMVGLHQTLEALHFFQWEGVGASVEHGLEVEPPSLVDGLPWTCLFMVLFPPFVPGTPKKHLLLSLSLATPALVLPLVWSIASGLDYWLILSPESFMNIPLSVVLGLFVSVGIHRIDQALREERRRSRDLGSYELIEELGHGGMGQVWLAKHKMLARPAALKLISAAHFESAKGSASSSLQRFEREARATALLRSLHTVELYDFGQTDAGDFYYAMELLDGVDLEALVRRHGTQDPWRVVNILRQACFSLAEAHEQGVVHRDIKPANIFLCRQGTELDVVKVLDFGLVTRVGRTEAEKTKALTGDNQILGTPAFMSPESITSPDEVDSRADIYALGCVAYWLLSGRQLFKGDTVVAQLYAHVHKELPDPLFADRQPPVPRALDALLRRMLDKEPSKRPQSASEVLGLLDELEVEGQWNGVQLAKWWEQIEAPPALS
jgi:eukaryotic-like serine/threonine-protein kinase